MTENPFETETSDPWKDDTQTVNAPEEKAGVEVSATLKAGSGYDAPWLVARGPNAAAIVAEMRSWFGEGGLIDATAKTAEAFKKATGNNNPRPAGGSTPPQSPPPGSDVKSCKHGAMTFRSGTSAKGPWKGYFCPTPQGTPDQCRPVFIK